MGVFVISPLPSWLLEPLQTAGLLRSTDITPLLRYYEPIRHPLAVPRLGLPQFWWNPNCIKQVSLEMF